MAADTAAKRLSAMNISCPWRGTAVVPSGTVDAGARAAAMFLYALAGGAPPQPPVTPVIRGARTGGPVPETMRVRFAYLIH